VGLWPVWGGGAGEKGGNGLVHSAVKVNANVVKYVGEGLRQDRGLAEIAVRNFGMSL
jgi:hypothetical protein